MSKLNKSREKKNSIDNNCDESQKEILYVFILIKNTFVMIKKRYLEHALVLFEFRDLFWGKKIDRILEKPSMMQMYATQTMM